MKTTIKIRIKDETNEVSTIYDQMNQKVLSILSILINQKKIIYP